MTSIRLVVADDHTLVREGFLALIDTIPDMEVIGQADNGQDAVRLAQELDPDVILLDLVMPRLDGLEAIQQILAHKPQQRILVISSFSEDEKVFRAIQSGAQGYLLKDCTSQELVQAIRDVYQGEVHFQPVIARKLARKIGQPERNASLLERLTEREKTVLNLVARGMSNKEIADNLVLSERTVDGHVRNILKKLQLSNRTKVALFAMKEGLSDHESTED